MIKGLKHRALTAKVQRNRLIALIATVLFCLFVVPINEGIAFTAPSSHKAQVAARILKLVFGIVLYCGILFALNFVQKLRAGSTIHRRWLYFMAIYGLIMTVFFILLYPGHWVWDEFNILNAVQHYSLDSWQGYFTTMYYTLSLYLIPTGVAIVLIQIVFISFSVGWVVAQAEKLFKSKRRAYVLFAPFLLFPVILNNFYPLRMTLYSYLVLLLLARLLFLHIGILEQVNKLKEILVFSTLIMLVSFWRTEGFYYLIVFPIVLILLGLVTRKSLRTVKPYLYAAIGLAIILFGYGVNKATYNPLYSLTATINPLSTMIHEPLKGDHIPERLAIIDKVVNLEILRKYPSHNEIPAYWKGAIRPDYTPYVHDFEKQYVYLIAHNPDTFLENRWATFLSTNTLGDKEPYGFGLLTNKDYARNFTAKRFLSTNALSRPINVPVKQHLTSLLLLANRKGQPGFLAHIFWNVMVPIVLLIALGIYKLVRKEWFWALIITLLLTCVPILFLTAPANYFMYYLPVYIVGYFLITLQALLYFESRKSQSKTKS